MRRLHSLAMLESVGLAVIACACLLQSAELNAQSTDSCAVTWSPIKLLSSSEPNSVIPRVVAHDPNVFVLWEDPITDTIGFVSSSNNGVSWSSPRYVRIANLSAAHLVSSGQRIYLIWTAGVSGQSSTYIASTTDLGQTWDSSRVVAPTVFLSAAAFGTNVFINVWGGGGPGDYYLAKSTDQGWTWQTLPPRVVLHRFVATAYGLHGVRRQVISRDEILYQRSLDFGLSWDTTQVLSTIDQFHSTSPSIAADSVPNVYVVWEDRKFGGTFSGTVLLRRSTDNGQNWLNEQQLSPIPHGNQPSIAAHSQYVHAVWDSTTLMSSQHSFYTFSQDYGNSWCTPIVFTDTLARSGEANIAAGLYGYLAWNRRPEVYFRRVTPSVVSVPLNDARTISELEVSAAWPNPFNPDTHFDITISKNTPLVVTIHNILGQKVRTLIHDVKSPGTYRIVWDGTDDRGSLVASGVYRLVVVTETERKSRSTILIH